MSSASKRKPSAYREKKKAEQKKNLIQKEVDPIKLFRTAKRMTGDSDILVIEAEMEMEGKTVDNPAYPMNITVARASRKSIEQLRGEEQC